MASFAYGSSDLAQNFGSNIPSTVSLSAPEQCHVDLLEWPQGADLEAIQADGDVCSR